MMGYASEVFSFHSRMQSIEMIMRTISGKWAMSSVVTKSAIPIVLLLDYQFVKLFCRMLQIMNWNFICEKIKKMENETEDKYQMSEDVK